MFEKEEGRVHEGRPVYVEMKKSDRTPFDATAPDYDPYDIGSPKVDRIVPAEIKYCNGRWVFSHPYIRKSRRDLVSIQHVCEQTSLVIRAALSQAFVF